MQTVKDASLLILVILILGSVRVQSTSQNSITFPASHAAQSTHADPRPILDHPALVRPMSAPATPESQASPDCDVPEVDCPPEALEGKAKRADSDCVA